MLRVEVTVRVRGLGSMLGLWLRLRLSLLKLFANKIIYPMTALGSFYHINFYYDDQSCMCYNTLKVLCVSSVQVLVILGGVLGSLYQVSL